MSSSEFTLRVNGLDQLLADLLPEAAAVVVRTAYDINQDMQRRFVQGKSGRRYGAHVASAPGEAPAVDTGHLRNSVQVQRPETFEALVTVGAEYAAHLEFGTRRMEARPYMGPAFAAIAPEFEDAMKRLFDAGTR